MALSAPELIREAMDALMHADAARLERLAQQAPALALPVSGRERNLAMAEQRAFGRLLELTRRNLRLLGSNSAGPGSYGLGRG
ncbi:MAG TPA: hypothetical protein VMD92_02635 [Acidobacteriaceae bacterium]|jgi:hypothetical protein|nr:hypothetical protein [Acidobacteriaceae bacterium]